MKNDFFEKQEVKEQKLYIDLLSITASLSNLYAESKVPFIYYRAMENIFCKAFNADNLSRSDVSADAGKNGLGIGLKTFLHNNGYTFQKVAEFNKESYLIKNLDPLETVKKVSEMRNKRILSTQTICNLNHMMYHLLTRSEGHMAIYEENMDLVDIDNIQVTQIKDTSIHFTDGRHEYSFNLSKSTLLKRFITSEENKILGFDVEILEDPYEFLLTLKKVTKELEAIESSKKEEKDYIVLPLYSPKHNKVEEKSGLNQWNASGRKRHFNEVYISVPAWIHKKKQGFFDYSTDDFKTEPFDVDLPNGNILKMKIAQQGGKALMSNPNSALGEWILRDILKIEENTLVTKEMLDIIGIDSVKLTKLEQGKYRLDFLRVGSYETFEETYFPKTNVNEEDEEV